jgi:hypothetical protein
LLPHALEHFETGHAGHPDIGNDHGWLLRLQYFQRAFAGIRRDSFEALGAQEGIEQAALTGVVIHDEDARSTLRSIATEDGRFDVIFARFSHAEKLTEADDGQKEFSGRASGAQAGVRYHPRETPHLPLVVKNLRDGARHL